MRRLVQLLVFVVFVSFAFGAAITRFEPLQDMVMMRFAANIVAKNQDALFAEDALRAVVCGSASPMPDPKRASACIAVFAGGHFYVVDTGTNSWENFATWRVAPQKIGAIFYSHFHSDHITDLGEFNMQTWVAGRPGPLRVFGAPGVDRLVGGFQEAYAQDRSYRTAHHGEDFVNPAKGMMEAKPFAMPAPGGPGTVILEENGLVVRAFAVDHAPIHPAVGYRFDYKGRSVVVSGDTVKSTSLVEASKDVDVLFHEAQANFAVAIARDANAACAEPGREREAVPAAESGVDAFYRASCLAPRQLGARPAFRKVSGGCGRGGCRRRRCCRGVRCGGRAPRGWSPSPRSLRYACR